MISRSFISELTPLNLLLHFITHGKIIVTWFTNLILLYYIKNNNYLFIMKLIKLIRLLNFCYSNITFFFLNLFTRFI